MSFLLTIAIDLPRKVYIPLLITEKVKILTKYLDFCDVFLEEKVMILLEIIDLK